MVNDKCERMPEEGGIHGQKGRPPENVARTARGPMQKRAPLGEEALHAMWGGEDMRKTMPIPNISRHLRMSRKEVLPSNVGNNRGTSAGGSDSLN